MEVENVERLYDMHSVAISKLFLSGFTNYGIHVDGVYRANVGMLVDDTADGAEHMVHGFSEVFSAVSRDYYKSLSVSPFKLGMSIIFLYRSFERVYCGVAGHIYRALVLSLSEKILP